MTEKRNRKAIVIPDFLTIRELAGLMEVSPIQVIKELMNNGIMANINQQIDYETAAIVAEEMGFEASPEAPPVVEEEEIPMIPHPLKERIYEGEAPEDLELRPPVVTMLGHVDHGKTTLLDVIRHTNVVAGEAGGITQHIGAYQVEHDGKKITFLDTPGHEAFTAMRARGAQGADIAILVVAADDGVMPQTQEAIDHARAARVPIIVALNKMDKANASPERAKQQLADVGLQIEEWGGQTICVPVSARKKTGIDDLLDNIAAVAELAELKANPNRPAMGTVIEGELDKSRGSTATLLVQNGTLQLGDALLIGDISGRIKAMFNERGERVEKATPSTPVVVLGLSDVPRPGDTFRVVENEKQARSIAAERADEKDRAATQPARAFSLEEILDQIRAGKVKELNLILKADVRGTIEPIVDSLERLGDEDLKVNILHQGAGNISESDVMLAVASQAIVIGFNVNADPAASRTAGVEGIDIRLYDIIYKLIDDVDKALKGLLEPVYKDVASGHAEVRAIFSVPRAGKIAGIAVTNGNVARNSLARISRNNQLVYEGRVSSLRRFTEDVKEVREGFECGVGLVGFQDFEEGDIIEFYKKERES
ncbi:MAG: translation initiation factor IF-2 [Anaerolineae bacterium]